MGKSSKKIPLILAIILFIISLSLLLFPTINNLIYQASNKASIKKYNENISSLNDVEKEKYLEEAKAYNQALTETVTDAFSYTYKNIKPDYESVLNFDDGQICSVEIPKIKVNLPVYHGTSADVLTKGAAHSANTSFPIGDIGTHSVISAHTAYPGKVFFDDLTELEKGDVFYINVLDERLAYKVCDIFIVEPDDTSELQISYDRDLVTLVTCYPYAVNSHRLYVRGERTYEIITSTSDKASVDNCVVDKKETIIMLVVLLMMIGSVIAIPVKKKAKK